MISANLCKTLNTFNSELSLNQTFVSQIKRLADAAPKLNYDRGIFRRKTRISRENGPPLTERSLGRATFKSPLQKGRALIRGPSSPRRRRLPGKTLAEDRKLHSCE